MSKIDTNKLVLFGAGKIGRSFIGQLFSNGGYEVVFIDVYKPVIDELNRRGNYNVIIKGDKEEVLNIKNIRGVWAGDKKKVIHEVSTAGILATSVGLGGLKEIFYFIAKGLIERYKTDSGNPVDIIIAENMRNADEYFRNELQKLLPATYPLGKLVGLVETSIGKMVPIMQKKDLQDDMLQIFAEPYNTLILNGKAFKNPIPDISGLAPKNNMKAWVDRKLFIHNLGHSAASYIGYVFNPEFIYLYEALAVKEIYEKVRATMVQSAEILLTRYPEEFTMVDLIAHIDDLLHRFQNKALGDTIFRIGSDLFRKLGPEDRLCGALRSAISLNKPYERILFALVCGFHFRAKNEEGNMFKEDAEFAKLYMKGTEYVLKAVCGFDISENSQIFRDAALIDSHLKINGS